MSLIPQDKRIPVKMLAFPEDGKTYGVKEGNPEEIPASSGVEQTSGTWTPSLSVSTGTNPTVTYVAQNGFWIKTGLLVHFRVRLQWSAASGGSGNLRINLPSALPSEDNVPGSAASINRVTGIPFTDQMVFSVATTHINIAQIKGDATYEAINASALENAGTIYIAGFYTVGTEEPIV